MFFITERDSKTYNRIKIRIQILEILIVLIFFGILIFTDLSITLRNTAFNVFENKYLAFLVFITIIGFTEEFISLPLDFYSGYTLEHKFNLSNQNILGWIVEKVKGLGLSAILFLPILLAFYFFIVKFGNYWWIPTGLLLFIFSILLSKIAPLVLFPIFYKFQKIEDNELKKELTSFCSKFGININGVFKFNLSKDTKKANAAFAGLGKAKRILLSDNLLDNFSESEIKAVFAHEVAHYEKKHMIKLIIVGFVITFLGLFLAANLYDYLIPQFGYEGITDIAAFPLLASIIFMYLLITMPLQNSISRKYEKDADIFAVQNTDREDFTLALIKLKDLNLADPEPHPLVEFLFYSHPSISKRINYIKG